MPGNNFSHYGPLKGAPTVPGGADIEKVWGGIVSSAELIKLAIFSQVVWTVGLFLAMLITRVSFGIPQLLARVSFGIPQLLAIATVPTIIVLLPLGFFLKLIIATVVMYALIVKLTNAKVFPDAFLVVGVSNVLYIVLGLTFARFL
jgi:hypothetical protein